MDGDGGKNIIIKMNSHCFKLAALILTRSKCQIQIHFPGTSFSKDNAIDFQILTYWIVFYPVDNAILLLNN